MPRTWRFALQDEGLVKQLTSQMRCSPLLARILLTRGYDTLEKSQKFINSKLTDLHDPDLLPGAAEAADLAVKAINEKRRITIYGDYDVDGVTSTSILWHCLKLAGANVDYYIPCRLEEGYGLNAEAIQQLHEEDPDRLLITVDCGISSVEHAELAKQLGLELIITDHHNMAEELPDAACLVHPRLPGTNYPFGELCGAGVALKVAWSICKRLGDGQKASPKMREFLTSAVALAAIGTIADMVPLVDENRAIVRFGLGSLPEHPGIGLRCLMKIAGQHDQTIFSTEDIGFGLAPRINAAGRLGQARLAVELLTTDSMERAVQLAAYLDQLNKQRQTVERKILSQAKELVKESPEFEEAPAMVLAHEDWHPGVIGIVANRVAQHFQKPSVLVALDSKTGVGQASGRSFAGCDLYSALSHCQDDLVTFGGHKAAVGMRIKSENVDQFRDNFCSHVDTNHEVTDEDLEVNVDLEVAIPELTLQAVTDLDRLGPFGRENERPLFAATKVELVEVKTMGGGDRHLSLRVKQHGGRPIRGIAFGRGEWAKELDAHNGLIDITFTSMINRFRGQANVEIQLVDWRPHEVEASV